MTIPVQTLKTFAAHASVIENNNLLPILSYWYIGNGKMVKNNLKQFVSMSVECEGEWLVEEKSILAFVGSPHSEVSFSMKDGRIFMTDGETKMYSATDKPENYPILPKQSGAGFNISPEDSISIGKAASCSLPDDVMAVKSHVMVGNGIIFGSDGFANFWAKSDLPQIVLSKHVATVIGKMDECYYRQSEGFHFLEHEDIMYGFAKDEAEYRDVTPVIVYDKEAPSFKIKRSLLVSYNNLCMQQSRAKEIADCSFDISGGNINLRMSQAAYSHDTERNYPIDGADMEPFYYNPAYMNKILKAVSDEEITIRRTHPTRIVLEGSDWSGIVMGIAKQ